MITRKPLLLSILPLLLFLAVYVPQARADTGQTDDSSISSQTTSGATGIYEVGNNFTGLMTDVQMNMNGNTGSIGDWTMAVFDMVGYTDGTYATTTGDSCVSNRNDNGATINGPFLLSGGNTSRGDGSNVPSVGFGTNGCNLQASEYYKLSISGGSTGFGGQMFFRGSSSLPSGVTSISNDFTGIAIPYFIIFGASGGFNPTPPPDTSTHIATVTPLNGSTNATSTAFTFGATGYVSPDNYISGATNVIVSFSNAGFASSQMVGPIGAELQQPDNSLTFTFPVTNSGSFSFSTTTGVQVIGNYTLKTSITVPQYTLLGFNFFTKTLAATSTVFVVATSTAFGTLQQAVAEQYQQLISTASSTIDTSVCNPISGNFNITACLIVVFGFPSQSDLNTAYNQFQTNVATHQPWGYFNRFFTILTSTGSTTLPTYTAYIGTGGSTTMDVITVDPGDMIAGAGTVLNGVVDPQNGMNIRQIMEPFVLLMVALGVLFTILADLLGSHRHNTHQQHGSKTAR